MRSSRDARTGPDRTKPTCDDYGTLAFFRCLPGHELHAGEPLGPDGVVQQVQSSVFPFDGDLEFCTAANDGHGTVGPDKGFTAIHRLVLNVARGNRFDKA